jgi:hypothetical protein
MIMGLVVVVKTNAVNTYFKLIAIDSATNFLLQTVTQPSPTSVTYS